MCKIEKVIFFCKIDKNFALIDAVALICETKVSSFSCRFLNHATLITEGDQQLEDSYAKSWRLCTKEGVEALKTLLGIIPL